MTIEHGDQSVASSAPAAGLPTASQGVSTRTSVEPDEGGHFGVYGGRHLPEALMAVIDEVTVTYEKMRTDPSTLVSSTGCSATTPVGPRRCTRPSG